MMSKKGFTLVELLAVIVLLAVIAVIAISATNVVSENIKKNMLDKKYQLIEKAAVLYGEDNQNRILQSNWKYKDSPCIPLHLYYLVPDYLDSDTGNPCRRCYDGICHKTHCLDDPTNEVSCDGSNTEDTCLDNKIVIIYYKNNRMHSVMANNTNGRCE